MLWDQMELYWWNSERHKQTFIWLNTNHDLLTRHYAHTWLAAAGWRDYFLYVLLRRKNCE